MREMLLRDICISWVERWGVPTLPSPGAEMPWVLSAEVVIWKPPKVTGTLALGAPERVTALP